MNSIVQEFSFVDNSVSQARKNWKCFPDNEVKIAKKGIVSSNVWLNKKNRKFTMKDHEEIWPSAKRKDG